MKLKNNYVLTEIGDDIMAVPMGVSSETSQHIIRLNETAADIWHGIEEGKSVEEIAAELVKNYDGVDEASALENVRNTVGKLVDAGIVEDN